MLPLRSYHHFDGIAFQTLYIVADLVYYSFLMEGFGMPVFESLWVSTSCLRTPMLLAGVDVAMGYQLWEVPIRGPFGQL